MIVKLDSRDLERIFANIDSLSFRVGQVRELGHWVQIQSELKAIQNETNAIKIDLKVAIYDMNRTNS